MAAILVTGCSSPPPAALGLADDEPAEQVEQDTEQDEQPKEAEQDAEEMPALEISQSLPAVPPGCRGGFRLLCRDARLAGFDFAGKDLRSAVFDGADLAGARFDNASLGGANFSQANLVGASFVGADLARAILSDSDVRRANFSGAKFHQTWFQRADAREANFRGATMIEMHANTSLSMFAFTNFGFATWTDGRTCKRDLVGFGYCLSVSGTPWLD